MKIEKLYLFLVLLLVIVLGWIGFVLIQWTQGGGGYSPRADSQDLTVAQAYARAQKSIVSINAETTTFLQGQPKIARQPGTQRKVVIRPVRGIKTSQKGAGVILHRHGLILTNAHVVQGQKTIEVILWDDTVVSGEVLGVEMTYDLAIIRVKPPFPLQEIRYGRTAQLVRGQRVVAVGNPYGLEHSVSAGVISATQRDIAWRDKNLVYENLIQTDIDLNIGNSGGPLLNMTGELVGINLAAPVGAQGISFAIDVDTARKVAASYLKDIGY